MNVFKLQAVATKKSVKYSTPFDVDTWDCETIICVENRYQSKCYKVDHKIGFCGADNVHREVMGGDLLQRPYAFLYPLATVISEYKEAPKPTIQADIDDIIILENINVVLKIVEGGRWADTKLIVLDAPIATVDHSEWIEANK